MGYPCGRGWYDGGGYSVPVHLCCRAACQLEAGHNARACGHHQRRICAAHTAALSCVCIERRHRNNGLGCTVLADM